MIRTRRSAARRLARGLVPVLVVLALGGCTVTLGVLSPTSAPRDAEGRPIAPGPASPSTCVTPPGAGTPITCVPVHNPPSRVFVEQAIPTLLPTRGYGSIEHPRCTERIPGLPSESDPTGLSAVSHWTCVGREPEGPYLHEDVAWTPASGSLILEAVTRDRSPALTVPRPNDPGLPNPHASQEPQEGTPSPSRTPSQHELAAH